MVEEAGVRGVDLSRCAVVVESAGPATGSRIAFWDNDLRLVSSQSEIDAKPVLGRTRCEADDEASSACRLGRPR